MIHCYGPMSEYLHLHNIPPEIKIQDSQRYISKLSLGDGHFIALLGDGSLMGVGSNKFGQLGLPFESDDPEKV